MFALVISTGVRLARVRVCLGLVVILLCVFIMLRL